MPYPVELNDSQIITHRRQDSGDFCDMIVQQFDEMIEQCDRHPLVMNVFERLVPPGVGLLETGEPVARQARRLLAQAGLLQEGHAPGTLALLGPGAQAALDAAASRWLSPLP